MKRNSKLLQALMIAVAASLCVSCNQQASSDSESTVSYKQRPPAYPQEMEEFRSIYLESALEFNAIEARPGSTKLWESKFLGNPYLPLDTQYPRDRDGKPLKLLAQLNFAEMPQLQDFPSHGIVQFFVSPLIASEHIWGALQYSGEPYDPDAFFQSQMTQDYFRVIYYEDVIEEPEHLQPKTPRIPDGSLPIDQEARLSFTKKTGYVLNDDYRFETYFEVDAVTFFERFGSLAFEVGDQYYRFNHPSEQAWVGGYAAFAQWDPRAIRPNEDWVLLLEIESSNEHGMDILWGDAGVGTFFIRRTDLQRKDFSKVLYYWDNH